MKHKGLYEVLGVVVAIAANGLSIYKKGKNEGRVSGGRVGDMVVLPKGESQTAVKIIPASDWEAMADDEKMAKEIEQIISSKEDIAKELVEARAEIERLKSEIAKAKKSSNKDDKNLDLVNKE